MLPSDRSANLAFRKKVSNYLSGQLPHCKEIITSTLLKLLKVHTPTVFDEPGDDNGLISRVAQLWPDGTKEALRGSLDKGIFDDWTLSIYCGPGETVHTIHFPLALVGDTGSFQREFSRPSQFSLSRSVKSILIIPSPLTRIKLAGSRVLRVHRMHHFQAAWIRRHRAIRDA